MKTAATMRAITSTPATETGLTEGGDESIMLRLKMRDRTALGELLDQHGSMMYGAALRIMRDETRAQEVVQDALITTWNKAGTYQGRAKLSTWLYRVVVNAALMQLRKQRQSDRLVALGDSRVLGTIGRHPFDERPDVVALRGELGEQVQRAIDALPEPYRTTVLLADAEELPIADIAELTNATVAATKSRLHKARLALRKKLSPYVRVQPRLPDAIALLGEFCAVH